MILVDRAAFLTSAAMYAALRKASREWGESEYAIVEPEDREYAMRWGFTHRKVSHVVSTPTEALFWKMATPTEGSLKQWLVEVVNGVDGATAKRLLARKKEPFEVTQAYRWWVSTHNPDWQPTIQRIDSGDAPRTNKNYILVESNGENSSIFWHRPDAYPVAIDFETEGEYPFMVPVGFSWSCEEGKAYYSPIRDGTLAPDQRQFLIHALDGPWIAHNAIFELHCLATLDVTPKVLPDDTMVLAWLEGLPKGLKQLGRELFGIEMRSFADVTGGKRFSTLPMDQQVDYGCADADVTLRVWNHFNQEHYLGDHTLWWVYEKVEKPLLPVIMQMERRGLRVDTTGLCQWGKELEADAEEIVKLLYGFSVPTGGFQLPVNWNSGEQVAAVLFGALDLDPLRHTAKGYGTDSATLRVLSEDHPLPVVLDTYRAVTKLKGTYADGLLKRIQLQPTGHLHPQFAPTGTKTGRLASKNPNGQNFPASARRFVVPRPGKVFVAADYGQIELRILAHVSRDPLLVATFEQGESPHEATLKAVFGYDDKKAHPKEYTLSKNINFGIPYGAGPDKLVQVALEGGIQLSLGEARSLLAKHRHSYPRVWEWIEETKALVRRHGYVDTLQGKRCYYPEVDEDDPLKVAAAERQAVNAVMQGTAGYFGKESMLRIHKYASTSAPLVLNIHDEIVVECKDDIAADICDFIQRQMREVAQKYLSVPVETSGAIGHTWAALK